MSPSISTAELMRRWSRYAREWLVLVILAAVSIGGAGWCLWHAGSLAAAACLSLAAGLLYRACVLARYLTALVGRIENRNRNQR